MTRREEVKKEKLANNHSVLLRFITWQRRGVYYPTARDVQIASPRGVTCACGQSVPRYFGSDFEHEN
jgi:hypothetical protein